MEAPDNSVGAWPSVGPRSTRSRYPVGVRYRCLPSGSLIDAPRRPLPWNLALYLPRHPDVRASHARRTLYASKPEKRSRAASYRVRHLIAPGAVPVSGPNARSAARRFCPALSAFDAGRPECISSARRRSTTRGQSLRGTDQGTIPAWWASRLFVGKASNAPRTPQRENAGPNREDRGRRRSALRRSPREGQGAIRRPREGPREDGGEEAGESPNGPRDSSCGQANDASARRSELVAQAYSELAPRLRSRASSVHGTASSRREPLLCLWLQCPRQVRLRGG
jgi:hypothetical protein